MSPLGFLCCTHQPRNSSTVKFSLDVWLMLGTSHQQSQASISRPWWKSIIYNCRTFHPWIPSSWTDVLAVPGQNLAPDVSLHRNVWGFQILSNTFLWRSHPYVHALLCSYCQPFNTLTVRSIYIWIIMSFLYFLDLKSSNQDVTEVQTFTFKRFNKGIEWSFLEITVIFKASLHFRRSVIIIHETDEQFSWPDVSCSLLIPWKVHERVEQRQEHPNQQSDTFLKKYCYTILYNTIISIVIYCRIRSSVKKKICNLIINVQHYVAALCNNVETFIFVYVRYNLWPFPFFLYLWLAFPTMKNSTL